MKAKGHGGVAMKEELQSGFGKCTLKERHTWLMKTKSASSAFAPRDLSRFRIFLLSTTVVNLPCSRAEASVDTTGAC